MARRRKRGQGFPAVSLVPPVAALAGWGYLREPLQAHGLLLLLGLGVIAGLMMPAVLLSAADLPRLLFPARCRAWYRHKRAWEDHWYLPAKPREEQRSSRVPKWLRRVVRVIDRNRCVWCHATEGVEIEHIRPWAAGGLSRALWNLTLLCGDCNKIKSDYWPGRWYTPFTGYDNEAEARAILRRERWLRVNPARWVRAGFALAA